MKPKVKLGQNQVKSVWPMAWLEPGFHPSYSGVQPEFCMALPVILLESFQVSATVTGIDILAFPHRVE